MSDQSFKNIVVGVDFSKYSQLVYKQALNLAKRFNAGLHVVYAAEDPANFGGAVFYTAGFHYVPPGNEEMENNLRRVYKVEDSAVLHFGTGDVVSKINAVAETLPHPLIVIGAGGHSLASRFILGTHAEKIALEAKYPVWVHRGNRVRHFQHILLPIDFSPETQSAVDYFKNISGDTSVRLNYLHVYLQSVPGLDFKSYVLWQKMYKKQMQIDAAAFKKRNPGLKLKVTPGNPAEEIIERAREYDLIAMVPHNKSGLFQRFGRITAKVMRLSPVPVLIFKTGGVKS